MTEGDLDFSQSGYLGEYHKIGEICAYMFELGASQLVQTHQLLDQVEILVPNYVLIMFY